MEHGHSVRVFLIGPTRSAFLVLSARILLPGTGYSDERLCSVATRRASVFSPRCTREHSHRAGLPAASRIERTPRLQQQRDLDSRRRLFRLAIFLRRLLELGQAEHLIEIRSDSVHVKLARNWTLEP